MTESSQSVEVAEPTFDQELAQEILDVFKFYSKANLGMTPETATELTRIYFTVSNLPQYADYEPEGQEE